MEKREIQEKKRVIWRRRKNSHTLNLWKIKKNLMSSYRMKNSIKKKLSIKWSKSHKALVLKSSYKISERIIQQVKLLKLSVVGVQILSIRTKTRTGQSLLSLTIRNLVFQHLRYLLPIHQQWKMMKRTKFSRIIGIKFRFMETRMRQTCSKRYFRMQVLQILSTTITIDFLPYS